MKILLMAFLVCIGLFAREADAPYSTYVPFSSGSPYLAVLSPDGQSFFTKEGRTVIQWQLSPLKKMNVIEISKDKFAINMFITKDQRRMILQSYDGLTLWDLKTKKLLKTINEDIYASVMNGSELITIKSTTLTTWNSETLEKISSMKLESDVDPHCGQCFSSPSLLMDETTDILCVVTLGYVFILNKNDFSTQKVRYRSKSYMHTSYDHKSLYVYLENKQPVKVDVRTGDIFNLPNNWIENHEKQLVAYKKGFIFRPYSSFNELSLVHKGSYRFFNNKTNKSIALFRQFEDKEGLLMNYEGYFDASSTDKKYLKIKTLLGEFIPIDDETYEKYHKKIF